MSIACLLIPSLALTAALAEQPALSGCPVALADERGLRVFQVTAAARRRGVHPGLTLREATASCPDLTVLEQRPARIATLAKQIADGVATLSPLVEPVEPGLILTDLRGLDGLYPDPQDLERAFLAVAPTALGARLGIAEQRFTAIVAAGDAAPGGCVRVPAPESATFLATHRAALLPLPDTDLWQLQLFGIETIGHYAALSRHAAAAQFGVPGDRAWLAASALDPAPVRPRVPVDGRVIERSQSEPPLVSRETMALHARQLLQQALHHPRAAHRFVRLLRLRATTDDDQLWERSQVLREPSGDRDRLWLVIKTLIEYAELPGLISTLELELGGLTTEQGRQGDLFTDHSGKREQLDQMVRQLKVRFGRSPMTRIVEVGRWNRLPERRYALLDYDP